MYCPTITLAWDILPFLPQQDLITPMGMCWRRGGREGGRVYCPFIVFRVEKLEIFHML